MHPWLIVKFHGCDNNELQHETVVLWFHIYMALCFLTRFYVHTWLNENVC